MTNVAPEFVAVILAASTGARLFPLTSPNHPKHLLPVGGIPMLARLLHVLHATGFTQVIICVASSPDKRTVTMLKSLEGVELPVDTPTTGNTTATTLVFQKSLVITCVPVDCAGSAEALQLLGDFIPATSHVLVLPADLVVLERSSLEALVDAHRQGNSNGENVGYLNENTPTNTALTMLLADVGEQDEHGVPLKESAKAKKGGLARDEEDIEYIGLSFSSKKSNTQSPRVLWKQSKIDVEQDEEFTGNAPKLILPKPRLRGSMTVRMDWSDLHVYVLSPWVRRLLTVRSSLHSLQGDLVPLLVGRQSLGIRATFKSTTAGTGTTTTENSELILAEEETEYAVRAHIIHGSRVMRASTIPSYLYACREVVLKAIQDGTAALPDGASLHNTFMSVILKDSQLGEKVQYKACSIGRNVTISAKCRLNNVVIMDNVRVGENCVLQNSILGEGCTIGENCNLNDCQVPAGKTVPGGTKEKGESFTDTV